MASNTADAAGNGGTPGFACRLLSDGLFEKG